MKPTVMIVLILAVLLAAVLLGCKAQQTPAPKTDETEGPLDKPTGKPAAASAQLSFHSFDGGGPSYTAVAEDASLLVWEQTRDYGKKNHAELEGASYTVTFAFTGRQPGKTRLTVEERSPIAGNYDHIYAVTVGEDLSVTLELLEERDLDRPAISPVPTLVITVGSRCFYAVLEDNPSAEAFVERLSEEPIAVQMHDYGGFEKVGPLPWELPRSDESITTEPGDVILYQGNQITVYYGENTWSFTRLAKIQNTSAEELKAALGDDDATLTFSVEWSE